MPPPNLVPINADTRLCAVLGSPIRHTASPAMHNAAFLALGLNWRYLAFEVQPQNLRAAIEGARVMDFAGLNLTVPHKLLALEMVDELDASAQTWGAVNTIKFQPGADGKIRAVGFNTDADGLLVSLRQDLQVKLRGAKVLLLGAGGAARTAALKLAAENVGELFLVNRTPSKAEAMGDEIKKLFPAVKVSVGYPNENDAGFLIVNATSFGLDLDPASGALPYDPTKFSFGQASFAYDMIYWPAETNFLRVARMAGCKTANGIGMLVGQGARAFEIWTGQPAPLDVMRRAVEARVYGGAEKS